MIISMKTSWAMNLVAVLDCILLAGCAGQSGPDRISASGAPSSWRSLFNGSDFGGWTPQSTAKNTWVTASEVSLAPDNESRFKIIPGAGILANGPEGKTTNIFTVLEHGDCELHVEFNVPKGSNSGVYLQGRYEVQVFDSFGKANPEFSDCGGIYARWINEANVEGHAPRVNASRKPGAWQSFDIKFRAPRFDTQGKKTANARFEWVRLNGVLVQENVEVTGPTRSAMDETKEVASGPLMLQGDHGPVAYRNIRIKIEK